MLKKQLTKFIGSAIMYKNFKCYEGIILCLSLFQRIDGWCESVRQNKVSLVPEQSHGN